MSERRISYKGKEVFIGIDVHKRTYTVTCVSEGIVAKRCTMKAEPEKLVEFVRKYFQFISVVFLHFISSLK